MGPKNAPLRGALWNVGERNSASLFVGAKKEVRLTSQGTRARSMPPSWKPKASNSP